MDKIDELLNGVENLPSSPFPLPELFAALSDADVELGPVVDMIMFDPTLTAKLLKTCNSAFFARSEPIKDAAEAVNRLGFQTVYRIVAAVKGNQMLGPSKKTYALKAGEAWKHAVTAAFSGQFVAEEHGASAGLFFTAGLLHDMGKGILDEKFKEGYGQVLAEVAGAGKPLVEVEAARYGMNHAEIGARLLERWKFSPEMVSCVQFHHHPGAAGAWERSAAFVTLANALAHQIEQAGNIPATTTAELDRALKILGGPKDDLTRYAARLEENVAYIETMRRVGG